MYRLHAFFFGEIGKSDVIYETRNHPEPTKTNQIQAILSTTNQNYPKPAKTTQNQPKSQTHPKTTKTSQNQPNPDKSSQKHPQIPEISSSNFLQLIF